MFLFGMHKPRRFVIKCKSNVNFVPCRFGYQFISIFSTIFLFIYFFVYLINYILYIYIYILHKYIIIRIKLGYLFIKFVGKY